MAGTILRHGALAFHGDKNPVLFFIRLHRGGDPLRDCGIPLLFQRLISTGHALSRDSARIGDEVEARCGIISEDRFL
jgi:hypothetical protein